MSAQSRIDDADALVAEALAIGAPDLDHDPGLLRVETLLRALIAATSAVASALVEANDHRRTEGGPAVSEGHSRHSGTPTRPYSGG